MGTIFYVGDIHGRLADLGAIIQSAEAKGVSAIVQVGDFGWGFPGGTMTKFLEKRARQGKWTVPIYTCFGNHDNWYRIEEMREEQGNPDVIEIVPGSGCFYVARGHCIDIAGLKHLFLGGAESTDKHLRTDGVDWWATEEADRTEFDKFFDALENEQPDTVITHDAPLRVEIYRKRRRQSVTPNMLENALKLSEHKPRRWYFGHHHVFKKWKIQSTKFYGCGLHGEYWSRSFDND